MKFRVLIYDPGSSFEIINWQIGDFIIMGALIFGTASLFILSAKKIQKKSHRILLAIALFLGFVWLWAELAVGIFTNWGN